MTGRILAGSEEGMDTQELARELPNEYLAASRKSLPPALVDLANGR